MNCHDAEALLRLDLLGECPPEDKPALTAHLHDCAACRQKREQLRPALEQLDQDLAELFRGEPQSQERVLRALRRRMPRGRWLLYANSAALAASILMAVNSYFLFRSRPMLPPSSGDPLAGVAVLWASPDAQWHVTGLRQIELTAGELWLRLAPTASNVLQITTPAAVATARDTEFFIEVRQPPRHAGPPGDNAMRWKSLVYVTVLAGAVQLSNSFGTVTGSAGEALAAEEQVAPKRQAEDLARRFAGYYQPVKVGVTPKVPAYTLPLNPNKIVNLKEVAAKLELNLDDANLKANGFMVVPGKGNEDIIAPYTDLKKREVPIFITADTLLHLYHIQFDETLKEIEEREFYPDMLALTKALTAHLENAKLPAQDENFREARKKALTFLAIGLKALDPKAALPQGMTAADVEQVLGKMKQHEGFWPDPTSAHTQWPLFRYAEDFSQYVPRGHYTRSETLKKYFVGLMWFGRMAFLIKGDPSYGPGDQPALVSVPESNQQTLAAALLTKALTQTELADKRKARDVWERVYAVTSFYVGLADDLGVEQYQAALAKVCGTALDLAQLAGEEKLKSFKIELAKFPRPAIYGGTGGQETANPEGPETLLKALDKTAGFRLMGQRFVPDSYMMGKLVFPTVGPPTHGEMFTRVGARGGPIRGFARGLDVMAVMGSTRARDLLSELHDDAYKGDGKVLSYPQALDALRQEYGKLHEGDWNRNLYWSWLYSLQPFLAEYKHGYPTFMTTKAYQTKSLNTALASWAQLRHDTILYAKQSYTMGFGGGIPREPELVGGYVEPLPEFYARLLALTRMSSRGLAAMKVLDDAATKRLAGFEKIIERLLAISEKELANQKLSDADAKYIYDFGSTLEGVMRAPDSARVRELERELAKTKDLKRQIELSEEIAKEREASLHTAVIADVHTDQNSRQVLEEGTGYVDLGLFVYVQPDGRQVIAAGPVLSYYEFKHPMSDRLTDEAWRTMLKNRKAPPQPEWTRSYRSSAGKNEYTCPPHYWQRVSGF